jgi:hypothetical protein
MSAGSIAAGFDRLFSGIAQAAAISHVRGREQAQAEDVAWRGVSAVRRVGAALQRERADHANTRLRLREVTERAEIAEELLRQLAEAGVI